MTNPEMLESPCINICELKNDDICSGCYRSLDEIALWSGYSDQDKLRILENTEQRKMSLQKSQVNGA